MLSPIDQDALPSYAPGVVSNMATYTTADLRPAAGGLFDEGIFGQPNGSDGESNDDVLVCGPRTTRFGRITLAEPVPHPLVHGVLLLTVPVLPADLRRVALQRGQLVLGDLNRLYLEVLRYNARIVRLRKLGIPDALDMIALIRKELARAVAALMKNERLEDPVRDESGRVLTSLSGSLKPSVAEALGMLDECAIHGAMLGGPLPMPVHRIVATLIAMALEVRSKNGTILRLH
ncbi:hypothetical protein LZC95_28775 [Pendulispora brunnea]|uniref:Uncharacterized protein n=1 Tax=Pendulispora brunnea TaxID=2905690 RepID=A0ABZ2JZD2_9BACT